MPVADPRRLILVRWGLVALLLAGGIVWAIIRGLNGYDAGFPAVIYDDVDQPPVLLFLVGVFFAVRFWRSSGS